MSDILDTTADASGSASNMTLEEQLDHGGTDGVTLKENSMVYDNDGLHITVSDLTAGDAYSGVYSKVTAADPSNSYGMSGYFEADISGTQAGEFAYGMGSWINTDADTVIGAGKYLCAQDNGIYVGATNTLTNGKLVFGMRAELVGEAATGALMFPFSVNTNNQSITALFDVNNISDLGSVGSKSTTNLYAPYARDAAGNLRYVLLYS